MRTQTRKVGLAACLMAPLGCGPHDTEELEQYRPRICGQDGPVQVLATPELTFVEDPEVMWGIDEVQGRWIVRRYAWGFLDDDTRVADFDAYLVGPCGEDPVRLRTGLWPLRLGDTLFGCDVGDGTVHRVDPHTGVVGAAVAEGLECEPIGRTETSLAMLDLVAGQPVLLDEAGELTSVALSLPQPEGTEYRMAPFLHEPNAVLPRLNWFAGSLWAEGDDGAVWRIEPDGTSRRVADDMEIWLLDRESGLLILGPGGHDLPEPPFPITLMDPATEQTWAGPVVEPQLNIVDGYVQVDGGFLHLREGTFHPLPPTVPEDDHIGIWPSGYAFHLGERFVLWEVASSSVVVDHIVPGRSCGLHMPEGDAVFKRWGMDEDCNHTQLWSYGLDGGEPQVVAEASKPQESSWLQYGEELLFVPFVWTEQPSELAYENLVTDEGWLLDRGVTGLFQNWSVGRALAPEDPDVLEDPAIMYLVEDGERTGLWRSELPR